MLTENKFSKYLIYAIGEIILVVIGILIAIQLNEWRNDSINTKQKQKVLLALKAEFEANLTRLDTVYYYQEQSLKKFRESKDLIDSIDYIKDNTVLKTSLNHGGYGYSYNPINGALRSAVSSGDIHLIKNERLIELLFSWEDLVLDSYEEIESVRDFAKDPYLRLLDNYLKAGELNKNILNDNRGNFTYDFYGLFKDPLFAIYTGRLLSYSYNYIQELKGIRINNLEILELIDEELK
ncbi:DUF6090 family protein [Algoriphagus marinus]|uniref:DUF6090 family protein n=1 Tax=Algoriphagus marinus TaxID=1925762 RepID=UPI00094BAC91|nr:DUF6090 family protein [Algoriphagus marinus]